MSELSFVVFLPVLNKNLNDKLSSGSLCAQMEAKIVDVALGVDKAGRSYYLNVINPKMKLILQESNRGIVYERSLSNVGL